MKIFSAIISAVLLGTSVTTAEAVGRIATSEDLNRANPCRGESINENERCAIRNQRRIRRLENAAVDPLRGGYQRKQGIERDKRSLRNTQQEILRKKLREFKDTKDVNTTRRSFINEHRSRMLTCMIQRPGRAQRNCLEAAQKSARQLMKAERESMQSE